MHEVKRKPNPTKTSRGRAKGRKPLGDKTLTCAVHLDGTAGEWLRKEAHARRVSQSSILRELVLREMSRRVAIPRAHLEERMDVMSAS